MPQPAIETLRHWIRRLLDFGGEAYPLPGLPLAGSRFCLRIFRRADEETRQAWVKFSEPYLSKYNFTPRGTLENDLTFQRLKDRLRLAVENESGEMIGYVSLKPIRQPDAAELGICFSADHVHQGYGTEALELVLPWAVEVLNLNRIVLEVDVVNACAVKLYQRLGFRQVGEFWYREVNPGLKRYLDEQGHLDGVRISNKQVELLSWKMEWTADDLPAR